MLLQKAWQNVSPSTTVSEFVNLVGVGFVLFF